ncbi:MAG TPA: cytochrome c peroxidase, partial [Anaerolineaceae bacterium]|nr:cytochrome c peroxidase [Anaerolineaceae bacterium]
QGALPNHLGKRKPPSSAYARDSPILNFSDVAEEWIGGMFYDGRATGNVLGDPLAEQAQGPFLNPLEQALPNDQVLCVKLKKADYADLFKEVWGDRSLDCAKDSNGVYEKIGRSVAAYERSAEVNPFSSKFDLFWDSAILAGKDVTKIKFAMGGGGGMGGGGMGPGGGGMGGGGNMDPNRWQNFRGFGLTDAELQGLAAFNDPNRANCASCHSIEPGSAGYPLFTSFTYDNVGMPKNPDNPFYSMAEAWNPDGENYVDYGLGGFLQSAGYPEEVYLPELGKFKVPSLRNVDLRTSEEFVKAYGHNGTFKSLEDIILFYAWRGLTMNDGLGMGGRGMDGCAGGGMGGGGMGDGAFHEMMCDPDLFPAPEVDQNLAPMNHFNMMDQNNILAFLKTLSDGYSE